MTEQERTEMPSFPYATYLNVLFPQLEKIYWGSCPPGVETPGRSLAMTITITAFEGSPDGGKGWARHTRVRWAREEEGQPYDARLVSFRPTKEHSHLPPHTCREHPP